MVVTQRGCQTPSLPWRRCLSGGRRGGVLVNFWSAERSLINYHSSSRNPTRRPWGADEGLRLLAHPSMSGDTTPLDSHLDFHMCGVFFSLWMSLFPAATKCRPLFFFFPFNYLQKPCGISGKCQTPQFDFCFRWMELGGLWSWKLTSQLGREKVGERSGSVVVRISLRCL